MKPVLPELIDAFAKGHPQITVIPTYGASGTLHSQVVNGAPFDALLSGDTAYPQKLVDAGLTSGPVQEYASGHLVVWVLKSSGLDHSSLEVVKDPRVKKIAIANPQHAPYGRAAEQALKAGGVYHAAQLKLIMGENVEQTGTFARTGAAEVGVLPRSLALSPAMAEVGTFGEIAPGLYEPIRHGAVALKSASDPQAAKAFLEFLAGPESKAVLGKAGLGP